MFYRHLKSKHKMDETRKNYIIPMILMGHIHKESNHWYDIASTTKMAPTPLSTPKSSRAKIRITGKNIVDEKIIPSVRLLSSQWYLFCCNYSCSIMSCCIENITSISASRTCKIYVNGERVSSVDLSYPPNNEPPRYCSGIFIVLFCFCFVSCFAQLPREKEKEEK